MSNPTAEEMFVKANKANYCTETMNRIMWAIVDRAEQGFYRVTFSDDDLRNSWNMLKSMVIRELKLLGFEVSITNDGLEVYWDKFNTVSCLATVFDGRRVEDMGK